MTLVELLVILGVIAVLLGVSLPALTGYAGRARLKSATRQAVGLISLARSSAISTREPHAVVVDQGAGTMEVVNLTSEEVLEQRLRLPRSITVSMEVGGESTPLVPIQFQSSGALAGRTTALIVADRQRQFTVVVTGATGAVAVQE